MNRSRRATAEVEATYTALWAHLQKRRPGLRTILVTGASSADDAAFAARALAQAASSVPNGAAGRETEAAAPASWAAHSIETAPHASAGPVGTVRVIDAMAPALAHATGWPPDGDVAVTIVVAPPPQESPECVRLASAADVTVLVATNGRTRFKDAQTAATLLGVADVEIAVALLVPERHTGFSAVPSARQIPATPASDGPATTPAGGRPRPAA